MNTKIFLAAILLLFSCCQTHATSNSQVTIHSKVFVSERTSNYFHRTFCSKLFTHPEPISYIECKKNNFKPCPVCNDKNLIAKLDTEYDSYVLERQKVARQDQERRIELQRLQREKQLQEERLREQRKIVLEEEQRKRLAEREREETARREREEALVAKHKENLASIYDTFNRVNINFRVMNTSGFDLPSNLFIVEKKIHGNLDYPVEKSKVDIISEVHCTNNSYVYNLSETPKVSCLFPSYNLRQEATVIGRRFKTVTKALRFDDRKVSAIINELNLELTNGYLYSYMTFENRTEDFVSIKDIYVSFDGVVCRAFSEELAANSNISVPPKASLKKIVVLNSVESGYGLQQVIYKLRKTFTKAELESNSLNISVSARYDHLGEDSDQNPFHSGRVLKYSELFVN